MSLEERIQEDFRNALKARNTVAVGTLRLLTTAAKNEQIAQRRPLTDEELVVVVQREVKKRREAAASYTQAHQTDRAAAEKAEQQILEAYLPEQLDDAALQAVVERCVAQAQATGPSDFGRVMGAVMKEVKGQADGNTVQQVVKTALGNLVAENK